MSRASMSVKGSKLGHSGLTSYLKNTLLLSGIHALNSRDEFQEHHQECVLG